MEFNTTIKNGIPVRVIIDYYNLGTPTKGSEPAEVKLTICWSSGEPVSERVLNRIKKFDYARIEHEAFQYINAVN